jgi:hypothetical protein
VKPIDIYEYYDLVMKGFSHLKPFDDDGLMGFTEDIFKLIWFASVKFNTFIAQTDDLTVESFQNFVNSCKKSAHKRRGKMGAPYVANAVVISSNVSEEVKAFALKRPKTHQNMDEFPIVVDIAKGEVYYYTGLIIRGFIYAKFEREYIYGHFVLPLESLKNRD